MLEKKLEIGKLNDAYGVLLTEHQREVIRLYHDCDISLFELSEQFGVSRQAVRDAILRGERLLRLYEEKLRLIEKSDKIKALAKAGQSASFENKDAFFAEIAEELD
ncbi:MAG: DNA-binding protein [Clostridiaceae bacterium]|jgi:predicted DNA-binding protein YlxM (UPF0122 family)|nr:DNA-binding protein [Clostridiaceae bacterium]